MVLLDLAVRHRADVDVFVLDTDFLFPDTYKLIDRVESRYNIRIRRAKSHLTPDQQAKEFGEALWSREPDQCCDLRKVQPMARAIENFDAWITAIRRDQASTRSSTEVLSFDESFGVWKICPLAHWPESRVDAYVAEHDLPMNPLLFEGYTSIGCTHCTRKPTGDDPRSGRWVGLGKTECGLHMRPKT
jgi:phosphoadenosine phosphosulfate reductase